MNGHLRLAPTLRLQWEEAQHCHVLLYPEGMVQLNPSAGAILQLCDGAHTQADIVATLTRQFPDSPELASDIAEFIDTAAARGWLHVR